MPPIVQTNSQVIQLEWQTPPGIYREAETSSFSGNEILWNITDIRKEQPEEEFGIISITELPKQYPEWQIGTLKLVSEDIDIDIEPWER